MGVAQAVQFGEQPLDLGVDPGVLAPRRGFGAGGDDGGEVAVGAHLEAAGQHGAQQPARQMEAVQRQHPALLGVQPVEPVAPARLGHREQAGPVGAQHQVGRDLEGAAGHAPILPDRLRRGKASRPSSAALGRQLRPTNCSSQWIV